MKDVDCIFHEAALASVPRSIEHPLDTHAACVTGTVMLLDAARRSGVRRVVYAASSSAYGDLPTASKRETDLPNPLSPYAAAKLAGELYCAPLRIRTASRPWRCGTSTCLDRGKIRTAPTRR